MIPKRRWPWVAQQNWENVLFIHTPVAYEPLRDIVPYPFEVDTYQGKGWMSIVLFQTTNSRTRYMPKRLSYPKFCQMNIRTYVRFGNERGVYFFSIHTDSRLADAGGRVVSLPFSNTVMQMHKQSGLFHMKAEGLFGRSNSCLEVSYQPNSAAFTPRTDSLLHFLSERYCVWMFWGKTIVKAPIFHTHWHQQPADTSIIRNEHFPFPITHESLFYYSKYKHAVMHPFERVGKVSHG